MSYEYTSSVIADKAADTRIYDNNHATEDDRVYFKAPLVLRALVSTKEAGVIIGKAGKNVTDLREQTGVKAAVSKVVQGVYDRILTITGSIEGVAKAFSIIAENLLRNPITTSPPSTPVNLLHPVIHTLSIRLLISHDLIGILIGRQGSKIKYIQDASTARMVASKEMLPQSTERVVEVHGSADAIRIAIYEIGKCLVENWEKGVGTALYNPVPDSLSGVASGGYTSTDYSARSQPKHSSHSNNGIGSTHTRAEIGSRYSNKRVSDSNLRTQEISIPADMVGCIIGKAGSRISETRHLSGSGISVAKVPHDETGERKLTIVGTRESNEKALYLLYGQLDAERENRLTIIKEKHVKEDEE
ncbi:RNA binding protein, heterogenous nuclear RNP-K like protein [Entomortierella lignicola]|nr:RNA binding protein, heterogenous nuclear RNP-K like protein [Entomortierella lignicola]